MFPGHSAAAGAASQRQSETVRPRKSQAWIGSTVLVCDYDVFQGAMGARFDGDGMECGMERGRGGIECGMDISWTWH